MMDKSTGGELKEMVLLLCEGDTEEEESEIQLSPHVQHPWIGNQEK